MRHQSSRFQEMKRISRDEGVLPCFVSVAIPQQTKALQTRRFCSKNRFLRGESRLTWKRFVNPFTISHPIPCSCSIFYITVIIISNISNVKVGRISSVSFEQLNLPDLEMFVNVFFFRTAAKKNTINTQKMMSRPRACWSPSSFKLVK